MAPDGKKGGNKRKRPIETPEEILARPWCYYCDRDFDDLKILVDHQKAKHFQCISGGCHRRLNTVGGLKVHMQQVHKEELLEVPNAIDGRKDLSIEIFGVEGIPPDVEKKRREVFMAAVLKEQAEYLARTGNPMPGSVKPTAEPPKKKKAALETKESIKAKAQAAKAKLAAKRAAQAQALAEDNPVPEHLRHLEPEPVPLSAFKDEIAKLDPARLQSSSSPLPPSGPPAYLPPDQHMYGPAPAPQSYSPIPATTPPGFPPFNGPPMNNGFPGMRMGVGPPMGMHQMPPVGPGMQSMQYGAQPPMGMLPPTGPGMPSMPMSMPMTMSIPPMMPPISMSSSPASIPAQGFPPSTSPSGYPLHSSSPVNGSTLPGLGRSANLPPRPPVAVLPGGPTGRVHTNGCMPFDQSPSTHAAPPQDSRDPYPTTSGLPGSQLPPNVPRGPRNSGRKSSGQYGPAPGRKSPGHCGPASRPPSRPTSRPGSSDGPGQRDPRGPTGRYDGHPFDASLDPEPLALQDIVDQAKAASAREFEARMVAARNEIATVRDVKIKKEQDVDAPLASTPSQPIDEVRKDTSGKSKKDSKKKKQGDINKQLLSDNTISWEEKRALAPKYARGPATAITVTGDVNDAVTGVVDDEMS